jgi:hypothetical protein
VSRNQTVEGQTYERFRSQNKRQHAWQEANLGEEYVDGHTCQARNKKQKSNLPILGAVQQSTQLDLLLDEAIPGPFNLDQAAQSDSTMTPSMQLGPAPSLDDTIPFEAELESHLLLYKAPFPVNPSKLSPDDSSQLSYLKDLHSSIEQENNLLVHPHMINFAAVVCGIELSKDAPVVHWPGGFMTCVPFVAWEDDASQNILALVSHSLIQYPSAQHLSRTRLLSKNLLNILCKTHLLSLRS